MDRRAFLSIVTGGGLLAAPLAAEAQTAGKVYRIGYLLERPPGQTSLKGGPSKRLSAPSATWRDRTSPSRRSG